MKTANCDQGDELYRLAKQLYPICRSITGDGVRQTLKELQSLVPLVIHEVPSGTQVLDWTIPEEWNIRDAWIKDTSGKRIVDFHASNLHVVNYSEPVRRWLSNEELQKHLFSLPDHPEWIPYKTSYYSRTWGFCLSERQRQDLTDSRYEVCIDSEIAPGKLTYGELLLVGKRKDEYLFSSHICHPSLANDNLSGVVLAVFLARYLTDRPLRWSYRFLFAPGTIGAITWLAHNKHRLHQIKGGMTLVCLGDSADLTYKRSFVGTSEIDRAAEQALHDSGLPHSIVDFIPFGYDERQYNSPGFRIPVGSLMRGRYGVFPQYHTSADNLDFISGPQMAASLERLCEVVEILERNESYRSRFPEGEPQLGKRGLTTDSKSSSSELQQALMWVLHLADSRHSLLDTAEKSQLPFSLMRQAADVLHSHNLIEPV